MKAAKSCIAFTLLILCSLLSGCWNRRELNDISIVLATGVDLVGSKYRVTVQVADPSQMIRPSPGNRSAGIIYSEEGKTVYEALRRITNKSPRQLYYGHLSVLFFNEAAARKGFRKPADFFFRMPEARPDFKVVVTHDTSAREILSMVPPFEITPALDFFKALRNSEKEWAPTTSASIFDLMQQLSTDGWEPSLTAITIIGDRKGAMKQENVKQPRSLGEYKYMGIAVFEDDKLVGLLNESDSKSVSYLRNKIESTVSQLPCPDSKENVTVQVTKSKSRIVPLIRNGEPQAIVNMFLEVNIAECDCERLDLTDPASYKEIENIGVKVTKEVIGDGVRYVQRELKSDIYGFGDAFHRKYPKQWKYWKDRWNDLFSRMTVEFVVHYRVHGIGEVTNPIKPANPSKEE